MQTLEFRKQTLTSLSLILTALWLLPAPSAAAQVKASGTHKQAVAGKDQKVTIKKAKAKKKKKKKDGWFPKLSVGITTSMVHTHQVPGVDNGLSLTLGAVLNGELRYTRGAHSWITQLGVTHAWSKTPTVGPFIKTADEANLKSLYEYRFRKYKKVALYGGLQLITPLAPGDLVAAQETVLRYQRVDGTEGIGLARADERTRLTKSFSPLIFKQLAGASARPYAQDLATLDVRMAIAGQEVWASGYTLADDKATPELELKELQDYQQLGLQLEAELGGKIKKNLVYAFRVELMYPFVTSIDTDLSGFDLLNTDLSFKLGLKISKWASLEYVFAAKRLPLIVNQWQITNNLVFSLTANIL